MRQPPLFPLDSKPKRARKFVPPTVGRTPRPHTCPDCHRTTLRVMVDGLLDETIDPITLSTVGDQAAQLLGIPTYRGPHTGDGPPEEYWVRFTPPCGDTRQADEYLSPAHQCGKPLLPGELIPVRPPGPPATFDGPPPY